MHSEMDILTKKFAFAFAFALVFAFAFAFAFAFDWPCMKQNLSDTTKILHMIFNLSLQLSTLLIDKWNYTKQLVVHSNQISLSWISLILQISSFIIQVFYNCVWFFRKEKVEREGLWSEAQTFPVSRQSEFVPLVPYNVFTVCL